MRLTMDDYRLIRSVVDPDVWQGKVTSHEANGQVVINGPDDVLRSYSSSLYEAKLGWQNTRPPEARAIGQGRAPDGDDLTRQIERELADTMKRIPQENLRELKQLSYRDGASNEAAARAITRLDGIIEAHPDYFPAYFLRGQLQFITGNFAGAERNFRGLASDADYDRFKEAEKLPPRWKMRMYAMFTSAMAGKTDEVLNECEQMLSTDPDSKRTIKELVGMLGSNDRMEMCEVLLTKVATHDPDDAEAYMGLLLALEKQEKWDDAERGYLYLVDRNPDNAGLRHHVGKFYRKRGMTGQAKDQFKAARRLDHDNPVYHRELGEIYVEQGRVDKAIGSFRWALELERDPVARKEIRERLTQLCASLGDTYSANYYNSIS